MDIFHTSYICVRSIRSDRSKLYRILSNEIKTNHKEAEYRLVKRPKLEKILPQYGHKSCYGIKSHRDITK
jgi:hypothetical protein